jgi:hypothetical protein
VRLGVGANIDDVFFGTGRDCLSGRIYDVDATSLIGDGTRRHRHTVITSRIYYYLVCSY